jgi:hypothetical protein
VFSVRSVPICYEQDKLGVAGSESEDSCSTVVVSCCCEKLVAEARGQFGNPEEGERPPIEAATK